jgi:L-fucose isomerase-like protein
MQNHKSRFALYFGNRGFFPGSLIAGARQEMETVLKSLGHEVLLLDAGATRNGGVETTAEGQIYANFLRANRGKYDGVILSLPNFGDETGAVAALQDAGVPIFIQAYPDEMDKMAPDSRRDSFCGKISIMDVFKQYGVKFTALKPHTVSPSSPRFKENIAEFNAVCQVVKGMRRMVVGAVGARTTPFKTVRVDEVALQRHGITVETLDFSDIIARVKALSTSSPAYQDKRQALMAYAPCEEIPERAFENLSRLGVVLDQVVSEYQMDAVAVRCWIELQQQLGISVCVLMGEMNNRGVPAACEVDIANAVTMQALRLASGSPSALLDWNNNYDDDEDRCILFHCGPVPASLMTDRGHLTDHSILANSVGLGCAFGCHQGRIAPTEMTFSGLLTDAGKLKMYLGEGRITQDAIPDNFFGCAGVAQIANLQDVLMHIGRYGFRHHVSITPGSVQAPLQEALENYLGFEISTPQASA